MGNETKGSSVFMKATTTTSGLYIRSLLFLLFINDIVTDIKASIKLFADDTSLYVTVDTPQNAADIINRDLEKIHQWSVNWLVKFNPQKTETGYF